MANKTKNSKLNGKMKRRMRKTTAVVLLITSIVVAAIPVPEAAAARVGDDFVTNITVEEEYLTADHERLDFTMDNTKVPVVTKDDTIYCSENGKFQFAYVKKNVSDTTNVAVLVGYSASNLDDGHLDIPKTLNAYIPYTRVFGTNEGNAAVTQNGNALYYKLITKNIDFLTACFEPGIL